jgi:hypothetical protein
MADRTKVYILIALSAVLAAVAFYNLKGASPAAVAAKTSASYQPIAIENPALHLDRIERLRKLEYHPTGRDIFTAQLPPPPRPKNVEEHKPIGPPAPPPEPALVVPFKYYGFSADAVTKKRLGFFTNGEDVYIAAEGELVQGKFRVVSIGNTWAEVEEMSSNRRARLTMEAPPPGTQ